MEALERLVERRETTAPVGSFHPWQSRRTQVKLSTQRRTFHKNRVATGEASMKFDRLLHTPELDAFRAELRGFLRDHLPADIRAKVAEERMDLPKEDQRRWHKILLAKGWVCPSWPREHGGPGWDDAHQYVFERELALADAPRPMVYGTTMLGPTLIRYGTDRQKATVLPCIRDGEDFWCQGFSEPNAGSDLAALQCRAVRQGDRYIVNGGKMWTSEGHIADRMFGLFRTDSSGKKQHGITFLMVDMAARGVEVQPIKTYDGAGREVNQVFFTDVEVPVENRVGEEHGGWTVAKYLLGLERFGIAEVSRSLRSLRRVKEFAAGQRHGNRSLLDDHDFARRVAQAEIGLRAVELTELRLLFGAAGTGAEASLLKLRGTELQNEILELMHDAVGLHSFVEIGDPEHSTGTPAGPPQSRHAAHAYFNYRKTMIYGGSNEIQRNIIAKHVLGL